MVDHIKNIHQLTDSKIDDLYSIAKILPDIVKLMLKHNIDDIYIREFNTKVGISKLNNKSNISCFQYSYYVVY